MDPEIDVLVDEVALRHGLDTELVKAVIRTESSGNLWSTRYEEGFYNRYISTMKGLSDTEMRQRATSFGLMQVMGQVAREQGFTGKYLTELCDAETGIEQGCRKLKKCLDLEDGDREKALLRYNGGGDKEYPARVMKNYKVGV